MGEGGAGGRAGRSAAACALVLAVAAGIAARPLPAPDAPPPPPSEPRLKAEFLDRFCRFIEWPADALGPADRPFVIGILGDDPIAPYVDEIARTRRIKERPVEVRRLATPAGADACHLVWVSGTRAADLPEVLRHTSGRPVLTVGDTEGFGEQGILINLRHANDHLGFEVNLHEVRRSRLAFSSKLLRLGTLVGTDREEGP